MSEVTESNDSTEDNSLRDDIAAAFDSDQSDEPVAKKAAVQEELPLEEPAEVKAEAEAEPEPEPEPAKVEEPKKVRRAPQSWKPELKETFNTLPDEFQEEILRRETDYAKGIQRNAELAKYAEQVKPAIDKWQPYLNQLQITPDKAFDTLIGAEYKLRNGSPAEKQQAFLKLAQDYGVDFSEQNNLDPNLQHAMTRVQQLEGYIREQEATKQQQEARNKEAEQSELMNHVEEFSSTHPHFEAARDEMSKLLLGGSANTLKEAYDKACWAIPEIRSTLLKEEEAKRIQEKAKIAEAAKAKAVSIKGTSHSTATPVNSNSIREDILAAMNGTSRL